MYEIGDAINGLGVTQAPADMPPEQIEKSWMDYFNHPATQAALLQAGTMLMQPIGIGQTVAGHIGQALQGGAMAAGRVATNEQEMQKQAAEQARLEQQGKYYEQQADYEGQRAGLAREEISARREGIQADKQYRESLIEQQRLDREARASETAADNAARIEAARISASGGTAKQLPPVQEALLAPISKSVQDALALAQTPQEKNEILRWYGQQVESVTKSGKLFDPSQTPVGGTAAPSPSATKTNLSEERVNARVQEFIRFYKSKNNNQEPSQELLDKARERARAGQ